MTIHYIDPPASAGKTYAIAKEAVRLANRKEPSLIIQPSIKLIRQTVQEIDNIDQTVRVVVITSENDQSAVRELNKALKYNPDQQLIIIATHQAFSMISYHAKTFSRSTLNLFCDEALAVHASYEVSDPCNHQLLTPHLSSHNDGNRYQPVILKAGGRAALARIADGRQPIQTGDNQTIKAVQNLARRLISSNWSNFILVDNLKRNPDGTPINDNLTIFSVLKPSIFYGFRKVTVSSAIFDQTLQFKLWRTGGFYGADGVDFKPRDDLKGSYRFTKHQNTDRLTIHTGYPKWSKTLRDRDDQKPLNDFVSAIKAQTEGGKDVLWSANNDVTDDLFDPNLGCDRLPHSPHGLNSYTHFNRFAMLSAYMPTPAFFAFMKERGIDDEELKNAISRCQSYQALMRTSLRNPSSNTPVNYYEPDASNAEFLRQMFKDCKIIQMTGINALPPSRPSGRPRVHLSDEDRKRQHRRKKYIQESLNQHLSSEASRHRIGVAFFNSNNTKCDDNTLKVKGDFVTEQYHAVTYDSIYRTQRTDIIKMDSFDGFSSFINNNFKRSIYNKEVAGIISPGYIDDRGSEHSGELKENVIWARHIYLDIDGRTDLTPEIIASIFPELRVLAYSTFNHSKENPRFRVILPTSQIMTPTEYDTIIRMIIKRIEDAGYALPKKDSAKPNQKAHGIDMSKLHPQAGYYLPSQGKYPDAAFFTDIKGDARGEIDPDVWLENAPPDTQEPEDFLIQAHEESDRPINADRVESAIREWRQTQKGSSNKAFLVLALRLRGAGMSYDQIEAKLRQEANHAHTPDKRRRQIKSIMSSLRRYADAPA